MQEGSGCKPPSKAALAPVDAVMKSKDRLDEA